MLTRRDFAIALVSICATPGAMTFAQTDKPSLIPLQATDPTFNYTLSHTETRIVNNSCPRYSSHYFSSTSPMP
jgi:hypothetical protein